MFSFEEYCEVYDAFPKTAFFAGQQKEAMAYSDSSNEYVNSLFLCAAVNDIQDDEMYFETIVNQCNIDTLNKLLPYFTEETRIARVISSRIQLIQRYGESEAGQKNKTDSIHENTFFPYLCSWIDKKGFISDSDFYKQAGISRQTFSKMRNSKMPVSREMALHLAVALNLNYDESVEFLKYAGYSFNPNSRREQIISFLIKKRRYSFSEIEEILLLLHEKTFLNWN